MQRLRTGIELHLSLRLNAFGVRFARTETARAMTFAGTILSCGVCYLKVRQACQLSLTGRSSSAAASNIVSPWTNSYGRRPGPLMRRELRTLSSSKRR
jgi:hypothetical protein